MRHIRILLVDDTPGELKGVITTLQEHFSQRDTNLLVDSVQNASGALERLSRTTPNPYDLVLLDIFDVDYKHVLGEVGSRYPYLPIVMFSRQEDPQEILRCMDLGARSFIFKLDLMIGARARTPQDAARDKQKWERVIDRLDRLAASYRPMKRAWESSLEVGLIEKTGGTSSIIPDQIEFLQFLQREMPRIAPWFPDVRNASRTSTTVSYEMPLYRMRPLRSAIFAEDDQERAVSFAQHVLSTALEFCTGELYTAKISPEIPPSFIEVTYFQRYSTRLQDALDLIAKLRMDRGKNCVALDIYEKLLGATRIILDGRELRSPAAVLAEIKTYPALLAKLTPPFLSLVHGDLHFENILVDDGLPGQVRIKLIDPRGFARPGFPPGTGDPAYDIGKLLHSSHGLYDFIHAGHLRVPLEGICYRGPTDNGSDATVEVPPLRYDEWATEPQRGGGSGDVITVHKRSVPKCARAVFASLDHFIREFFSQEYFAARDPNWLLRASLHEALHFCTLGKFHLADDAVRAIALHIRGIELLNDFLAECKAGRLDPVTTT